MPLPLYHFYLASTSPIKHSALRMALGRAGVRDFIIYPVSVPSDVPAQPIGDQTRLGLFNRLHNLRRHLIARPNTYLVAMENGLFPQPHGGAYTDKALVAISTYLGETTVGTSRALMMPARCVRTAAAEGFDKTTVGDIIARQNPSARPDDPHLALSGTPRAVYFAETAVPLLTWALPELRP